MLEWWCTSVLAAYGPKEISRVNEVHMDFAVLLFSPTATLLTGVLFGLVPALRASRVDLVELVSEIWNLDL